MLGSTPVCKETTSPEWTYQEFKFGFDIPRQQLTEDAMFEITIMDHSDSKTKDNTLMGVVPVPIKISSLGTNTKWYRVPASSAEGEKATGRLQCILQTQKKGAGPPDVPKLAASTASNEVQWRRSSQKTETQPVTTPVRPTRQADNSEAKTPARTSRANRIRINRSSTSTGDLPGLRRCLQ